MHDNDARAVVTSHSRRDSKPISSVAPSLFSPRGFFVQIEADIKIGLGAQKNVQRALELQKRARATLFNSSYAWNQGQIVGVDICRL